MNIVKGRIKRRKEGKKVNRLSDAMSGKQSKEEEKEKDGLKKDRVELCDQAVQVAMALDHHPAAD